MTFSTGFRTHLLNQLRKHKFEITSIFIILGIGGVVAATNIVINSGAPISIGSGSIVATACDDNITIKALTGIYGEGSCSITDIVINTPSSSMKNGNP